jgi:hypothetical protein
MKNEHCNPLTIPTTDQHHDNLEIEGTLERERNTGSAYSSSLYSPLYGLLLSESRESLKRVKWREKAPPPLSRQADSAVSWAKLQL